MIDRLSTFIRNIIRARAANVHEQHANQQLAGELPCQDCQLSTSSTPRQSAARHFGSSMHALYRL